MRLRHIPGAEAAMAQSAFVIQEPQKNRGSWNRAFENNHPIHIEAGTGKGKFLMELAALHPEINYIGIERYPSVLLKAVQKLERQKRTSLLLMCADALELPFIFAPGEVERIYLNFSDPWPKDRHAKRRLTSPRFLEAYDQVLSRDGTVEFKTDNRELFEYSLESVLASGWRIREQTFDLHNSPMARGNVMTEYETKFAGQGKAICKLTAYRQAD